MYFQYSVCHLLSTTHLLTHYTFSESERLTSRNQSGKQNIAELLNASHSWSQYIPYVSSAYNLFKKANIIPFLCRYYMLHLVILLSPRCSEPWYLEQWLAIFRSEVSTITRSFPVRGSSSYVQWRFLKILRAVYIYRNRTAIRYRMIRLFVSVARWDESRLRNWELFTVERTFTYERIDHPTLYSSFAFNSRDANEYIASTWCISLGWDFIKQI